MVPYRADADPDRGDARACVTSVRGVTARFVFLDGSVLCEAGVGVREARKGAKRKVGRVCKSVSRKNSSSLPSRDRDGSICYGKEPYSWSIVAADVLVRGEQSHVCYQRGRFLSCGTLVRLFRQGLWREVYFNRNFCWGLAAARYPRIRTRPSSTMSGRGNPMV